MCPVLVPSEIPSSIHLPTSEGWAAELTVGVRLVAPTMGFDPTRVDVTRFEIPRLNDSALPRKRLKTPETALNELRGSAFL